MSIDKETIQTNMQAARDLAYYMVESHYFQNVVREGNVVTFTCRGTRKTFIVKEEEWYDDYQSPL